MPEVVFRRSETLEHMQNRYDRLRDLIDDPLIPDEERSLYQQEYEELVRVELPRKSDHVAGYLRYCHENAMAAKNVREWADDAVEKWTRREKELRGLVKLVMQVSGTKSYKGAVACITLSPGRWSVDVYSMAELPLEYCKISEPKLTPNIELIKQALEGGIEVPGVRLIQGDDVLTVR